MTERSRRHGAAALGGSAAASRRRVLRGLAAASVLPWVAACGRGGEPDLPPPGTVGKAALLAPLSGPSAALGQVMREAASLGGNPVGPMAEVEVLDAGTTDESAVAAARTALANGARMLIGPLFSGQSRAVAAAVGRDVPVVSLSNDSAIAGGNLFVFGLAPVQSAQAVLGFAAARGLRRVAVVVPPGEFGARSAAAAQAVAPSLGLALATPVVTDSAGGLVEAVTAASGGARPDAVYLPVVGRAFAGQAEALAGTGAQLLGSDQWSAIEPYRIPALRGAWFAAPDPIRFEAFALALEERVATEAGIVAGLAFDAVEMARLLGRLGQQDRDGLLREGGFDGVLGPYRFLPSGQCERALAVLNVAEGATTLIGSPAA
ncbi:penicillin-binding protein activator [Rubellimicrobium roseum]|nr:penicillin-binding protein activator [Rubellimicrobium roseum]